MQGWDALRKNRAGWRGNRRPVKWFSILNEARLLMPELTACPVGPAMDVRVLLSGWFPSENLLAE